MLFPGSAQPSGALTCKVELLTPSEWLRKRDNWKALAQRGPRQAHQSPTVLQRLRSTQTQKLIWISLKDAAHVWKRSLARGFQLRQVGGDAAYLRLDSSAKETNPRPVRVSN
jgi:hypothetical protein